MEGVGSRLGRASSRYGPAAVFNGPVRKWRKQWVPFSSSYNNSFRSNNNTNNNNNVSNGNSSTSPLLLCRWTPISTSDSVEPVQRPRRKFRYTPVKIVVLEDQKKEVAEKGDDNAETKAPTLTTATLSKNDDACEKPNTKNAFMEEFQAEVNNNQLAQQCSNASHLNLDLGLEGDEENHESGGENQVVKLGRVSSGEFGEIA